MRKIEIYKHFQKCEAYQVAQELKKEGKIKHVGISFHDTVDVLEEILKDLGGIPCTACRYCVEGCPMKISIPDLFACYNAKKQFNDWNSSYYYGIHTKTNGKASDCIKCGMCENICPQHLKIRELLEKVAETFE